MKRMRMPLCLAALIILSSCTLLFRGTYPGDLAQARAQVDLSTDIAVDDARSYTLSLVKQSGREFLLLSSAQPMDPSSVALLELNTELDVLGRYTGNDLGAISPSSKGFAGDGAVVRFLDGHVIVGNLDMTVGSSGLQPLRKLSPYAAPPTGIEASLKGWTVAGDGAAGYTWTGFSAPGDGTLQYDAYAGDWSSVSHVTVPIGGSYGLTAVLSNPEEPTSDEVWLVFYEPGSKTKPSVSYFVPVSKSADLLGGFPGGPILEVKASKVFTLENISSRGVYATSDSFVAFDDAQQAWARFLPSDPTRIERVSEGRRSDALHTAFSFSGHSYYVWDADNRTLTAYDAWW